MDHPTRRWRAVAAAALAASVAVAAPAAHAANQLHIVVDGTSGALWHSIRFGDGSFSGWGNLKQFAGNPGSIIRHAVAMDPGGNLHIIASTVVNGSTDRIWHTVRATNGAWDTFAQRWTGPTVVGIGAAVVEGSLHVCLAHADGAIRHTVGAGGSWSFGDVKAASGSNPGQASSVGCTSMRSELRLTVNTNTGVWSTVRAGNGSWIPFQHVPGSGPGTSTFTSSANPAGDTHIVTTNVSTWFHSIRKPDGWWFQLGNGEAAAGSVGNGSILGLAAARFQGQLPVMVTASDGLGTFQMFLTTRHPSGSWAPFQQIPHPEAQQEGVATAGFTDSADSGAPYGMWGRHWRSLHDLSSGERTQLANLLKTWITDATVSQHLSSWHHNGDMLFVGHRGYLAGLETWLMQNGGAQFVPLPYWDPATQSIPAEFMHVEPFNNGSPRVPLPTSSPATQSMPTSGRFPDVCSFNTAASLAAAVESWHDSVHDTIGGSMANPSQSSAALIFFPWHAFVDNIYGRWLNCR